MSESTEPVAAPAAMCVIIPQMSRGNHYVDWCKTHGQPSALCGNGVFPAPEPAAPVELPQWIERAAVRIANAGQSLPDTTIATIINAERTRTAAQPAPSDKFNEEARLMTFTHCPICGTEVSHDAFAHVNAFRCMNSRCRWNAVYSLPAAALVAESVGARERARQIQQVIDDLDEAAKYFGTWEDDSPDTDYQRLRVSIETASRLLVAKPTPTTELQAQALATAEAIQYAIYDDPRMGDNVQALAAIILRHLHEPRVEFHACDYDYTDDGKCIICGLPEPTMPELLSGQPPMSAAIAEVVRLRDKTPMFLTARRKAFEEAIIALRALPTEPPAQQWMPIESAPKDGEDVLLWMPADRSVEKAFWREDANSWDTMDGWLVGEPSHWMPLPEPPTNEEKE